MFVVAFCRKCDSLPAEDADCLRPGKNIGIDLEGASPVISGHLLQRDHSAQGHSFVHTTLRHVSRCMSQGSIRRYIAIGRKD